MSGSREEDSGEKTILPWHGQETVDATPTPSKAISQSLDEERLLSPKSLNECADHLLDSMDNLSMERHEDIELACKIAKQIQGLARVKLDIYKTVQSVGFVPKRERIIELHEQGVDHSEIAKQTGCSEGYIYKMIKD